MAHQVGPEEDCNWSYSGSNSDVATIQVFRPTWAEFKDFNKYLKHIEDLGAHKGGIAKIIPPDEWVPCKKGLNIETLDIKIPDPICQVVNGNRGIFQCINVRKKSLSCQEYRKMALSKKYRTPIYVDYEDMERKYWKNLTFVPAIYGADVQGSITDDDCDSWNIQRLGSILDWVNEDYNIKIDGVNTAYLYFGMWKSAFAWHTEDMDLHSINYLHYGESKFWYSVPTEYARRFERMANGLFPNLAKECPAYLRHKMCMISPTVLRQNSIPYNKVVQKEGEIMITFPLGYHSGFNTGFNIAESTNFATERWVEYGKRCTRCYCKPDTVHISMDCFVKRLQSERYDAWLNGTDYGRHPEEPNSALSPAPAPTAEEFMVNSTNKNMAIPLCLLEPKTKKRRHPIHKKKSDEDAATPSNQKDCELSTSLSEWGPVVHRKRSNSLRVDHWVLDDDDDDDDDGDDDDDDVAATTTTMTTKKRRKINLYGDGPSHLFEDKKLWNLPKVMVRTTPSLNPHLGESLKSKWISSFCNLSKEGVATKKDTTHDEGSLPTLGNTISRLRMSLSGGVKTIPTENVVLSSNKPSTSYHHLQARSKVATPFVLAPPKLKPPQQELHHQPISSASSTSFSTTATNILNLPGFVPAGGGGGGGRAGAGAALAPNRVFGTFSHHSPQFELSFSSPPPTTTSSSQLQTLDRLHRNLVLLRDRKKRPIVTSVVVIDTSLRGTWHPPMRVLIQQGDVWKVEGFVIMYECAVYVNLIGPQGAARSFMLPFRNILATTKKAQLALSSNQEIWPPTNDALGMCDDVTQWEVHVCINPSVNLKATIRDPWRKTYLLTIPGKLVIV